jgi:hypothetical protein
VFRRDAPVRAQAHELPAIQDTGHVPADGGGRELAYVAMSRARHATHIYTTADDITQAVEDLKADRQQEHRPRWAIDTGLPITADARAHEQDLDQRQLANVLAIAAHERTGSDSERSSAVIAAELDRYRAHLGLVDPTEVRRPSVWLDPKWRQPARDNGIEIGM